MSHSLFNCQKPYWLTFRIWLFLFLLTPAIGACQTADPTSLAGIEYNKSSLTAAPSPTPLAELSGLPDSPVGQSSDAAESTPAPLRFTFPTPGPEAASNWRPPLYEVPWALGPYDHFYFVRPIAVDQVNWPLANYRYGYIWEGATLIHTGIDIDAEPGSPILAAGPGVVLWAGYGAFYNKDDPNDPYGLAVSIKHDFGHNGKALYTIYAHMERIDVVRGQHVNSGDQLGVVGSTGKSTGPHLHFEVRMEKNNYYATFNPELWIAPPQGWGILAGQVLDSRGNLLTEVEITVTSLESGKIRTARSYGQYGVNGDEYYNENLVLADLPAGEYRLGLDILNEQNEVTRSYQALVTIRPGAITYFTFTDKAGFDSGAKPVVVETVLFDNTGNP